MGMGEAINLFFARYVDFQGRSRRSEYWWVVLAYAIIGGISGALLATIGGGGAGNLNVIGMGLIGILILIGLAVIVPGIALSVRRFHDLGQTGWLVLVFTLAGMIPIIGLLASLGQLIWFAMPGTTGPNKYGADPKGGHDVGVFS
ncbi:MAG: DUF805 domain-containing protein [Pseudomonadota bacterium]